MAQHLPPAVGIAPVEPRFVLPAPPRQLLQLPRLLLTDRDEAGEAAAGGDAALAQQVELLADSQQQMLAELQQELLALDAAIGEAPLARLKSQVAALQRHFEWLATTPAELRRLAAAPPQGQQALQLLNSCAAVAAEFAAGGTPVTTGGDASLQWVGEPARLRELMVAGLCLLAERTGSAAGRRLLVVGDAAAPVLLFRSLSAAVREVSPATIQRFRQAVAAVAAAVQPTELGPHAPAFAVELPVPSPDYS